MKKTIKTSILSATLAVMFLSAGAFAGAHQVVPSLVKTNVTIIHKNSVMPLKGQITTELCTYTKCIEA